MKILNLKIENIKRVKTVDITPDSNTVTLGGKNGHGKTSTIDSILMALGGGKMIPLNPVRDGEEKALIKLNLGELEIIRKWTKHDGKSTLKVKNADGRAFTGGQDILNNLVGNLTFDPLKFATLKKKERVELLKKITGLNFDSLNDLYKKKYEERTTINRDIIRLKANVEKYDDFKIIPEIRTDIDKIKKQRADAIENNNFRKNYDYKIKELKDKSDRIGDSILNESEEIDILLSEIEDIKNNIKSNKVFIAEIKENINDLENRKSACNEIDLTSFDYRIDDYYREKEKLKQYDEKHSIEKELESENLKVKKINNKLSEIDSEKLEKVKNAKMPIGGLSLENEDISFNGMLFDNLSTAEQIKISMSVAIALNPSLKIAFIHNGSLLDAESMNEIKKIAEENDFQIWIEKVCDGPEDGILFIEDGELRK